MQRILVLSGIFGVLTFGILFCKLWQLQVVQHEKLENKAITQQTREISSTANRGTIYDANGDILAISGSVQNVILSPRDVLATVKVDEKDEFGNARSKTAIEAEKETKVQATYDLIADEMSEILGLDREDVMARLKKTKSAYEVLAEKVEDDVADQIRAFIDENDLEGCLYLTADSKRYYPYSTMASQVIGFVNKANEGAYGLEALYNLDLAGQDGKIITAKNASGTEMPSAYSSYTDAVDGYNVHTTIDATIQMYAEMILGLDREDVMARLKKTKSAYEVLAEKVEDDVADQIRAFIDENDLEGCLYLTADSKRYYPYSTMASQVIGFVNKANEGAYGLEALYNLDLAGQDGKIITAKNASGTEMPSAYSSYTDAVDGYNVHTTIDATIQMYAEKTLEEGIQKFDVTNGGFCLVMEPDTGAVLAMASSPDYDLNDPNSIVDATQAAKLEELKNDPTVSEEEYAKALSDAQLQQWANKNMRLSYEPGSTFKPVVVAAALEEGVIDDNSTFYCRGAVTIDNWTIRCSARSGHGSQSLRKAVMNSCNPALIDIGKKLGAEKFYEYWENFGFTSKTGIELPSEEKSTFWDKELFVSPSGVTQLATASFGQRFTTTPIHLITALSAVINGGHLLEPYLVQSVTDAEGNVVSYHEPKEVRQVISQETSDLVRSYMESVVNDPGGTGKNAKVEGYHIGGKTGSSQTLDSKDHIIVSFLGFAPADDPEVIVLLGYDWPQPAAPGENTTADGIYISGGNMAAPMAGELIANILDYLGYEKSGSDVNANGVTIPHLVGKTPEEARTALNNLGLNVRLSGEGAVVTDQMPTAGSSVPKGSSTVLYLGEEKPETTVEMPDLSGMTYDEAKAALEKVGLYLEATGTGESGKVFSQSVNAGTVLDVGTAVEVKFTDDTAPDNGVTTGGGWAPKEEEE